MVEMIQSKIQCPKSKKKRTNYLKRKTRKAQKAWLGKDLQTKVRYLVFGNTLVREQIDNNWKGEIPFKGKQMPSPKEEVGITEKVRAAPLVLT